MIYKKMHALFLAAAIAAVSALPASASPIDYADKNIITVVQTKLNEAGYDCGTPDGVVGAKTRQAIKDYRASKGLAESETIDSELFNALTLSADESKFVDEISAVCAQTIPESMTLQGITLYNYDLCISIDPGAATTDEDTAQPAADEAPAEFSPTSTTVLTDEILKLEDGADLWDTITISFTGLTEVVSGREDLEFAEGVSPEVKEFLASYEAFVSEYSSFLETYDQNNFTQQTQYLKYLHKYSEISDQAAELGASDLSETDKAYFDAVMARAAKRLGDYA
ncbi:MAG: peptidoglycan-binding protein [Blautia sp.]|nr:peptidoglycan-binding protein [Blautia sp.]